MRADEERQMLTMQRGEAEFVVEFSEDGEAPGVTVWDLAGDSPPPWPKGPIG